MQGTERQSGTVIAGRYTLETQLGEGAFGAVWIAADGKAFGRRVAVKFLLEQHLSNQEVVRRFWQEGQATAALSHPNVVGLLEFGEDHGVPYLVSEYVEGEPLRKVLDRAVEEKRLLSVDEVLAIYRQACAGVLAAHQKKIVHRDLKPENIMVTGAGTPSLVVKVLDFGVARILGKDSSHSLGRTEMGKVIGSLQYMSPEQVLGDVPSIDRRTDVFAMGAVLFEMFALRPAFDGTTYQEVIGKILDPTRPKLAAFRPDVGALLDPVLDKAFAMHRDQRFVDVSALLEAVDDALIRLQRPRRSTYTKAPVIVPDLSGQWGHAPVEKSVAVTVDAPRESSPRVRASTPGESATTSRASKPNDDHGQGRRMGLLFLSVFFVVAITGSIVGTAIVKRRGMGGVAEGAGTDPRAIDATTSDAGSAVRTAWTPPPEDPSLWHLVTAPSAPVALGRATGAPDRGGFTPAARVSFAGPAFRVMKREVTFGEFEAWCEANSEHRVLMPPWVPSMPEARAALPAVNVAWASAKAYCEAIGGSLPTEEQWEYAARGTSGRLEPWEGPAPEGLPAFEGRTGRLLAAGSFAPDATPDGVSGLASNGQEWTSSDYRNDDGSAPGWQQPYRAVRGLPLREALPSGTTAPAAFLYRNAGCASAACSPAERLMLENVGFRCVKPAG